MSVRNLVAIGMLILKTAIMVFIFLKLMMIVAVQLILTPVDYCVQKI